LNRAFAEKVVFEVMVSVFEVDTLPPRRPVVTTIVVDEKIPFTEELPVVREPLEEASAVTAFDVMIAAIWLVLSNQAPKD
jgi:hypothetical protein